MAINLPIFIDDRTPRPFVDPTIPWQRNVFPEDAGKGFSEFQPADDLIILPSPPPEAKNGAALIDHIYMDAMGFGMGCCCLQVTFQCCNIDQARRMYDSLIPIGPIMVCVSFANLFYKNVIPDSVYSWP